MESDSNPEDIDNPDDFLDKLSDEEEEYVPGKKSVKVSKTG